MAIRASNFFRRHLAGRSRIAQVATLGAGVTITAFGVAVTAAAFTEWKAEHGSKTDENAQTLPRCYDLEEIHAYWSHRPISVARRMIQVSTELFPLAACVLYDAKVSKRLLENHHDSHNLSGKDLQKWYAQELRTRLTTLGPAFVKMGQQLSIRPDLIPAVVIGELNKLCDSVDPVPDDIAFQVMEREFQRTPNEMFDDLKLVASASLGQVYKAKIKESGEWVAIKVQRPDMLRSVSLDLYLLHHFAVAYDAIVTKITHQSAYHVGLVDAFAKGSYQELDYENEAANQIRFATEFQRRKCPVHVPKVYLDYTTRCVLTSEWIDGIKLSDAPNDVIKSLIPVGVELFLTQLLDIGTFHADPHPGNLCVRNHNQLVLLDFGLCATIDEQSRMAMTAAIVHLLAGDFDTLVSVDAKRLGFLPDDLDTTELQPLLKTILTRGLLESGSNLHARKRKLMEISNELNEVFFKYPFTVPPFFALVTRGLGLLEGIALSGDPSFDIFKASYPFARRRALEVFGAHSLNQLRGRNTSR